MIGRIHGGLETYDVFRERATDPALSPNEKCGFPDALRAGRSERIYADIRSKLTTLGNPNVKLLDIGPGCSELAQHVVDETGRHNQHLTVIDSAEMLRLLPDSPHLAKIEGPFPACLHAAGRTLGPFDAILAYSVAHHVFFEASLFAFVDAAVQLLADRGQLLIGDIPNATMRKRFMASAAGKAYHKIHYSHLPEPDVVFNALEPGQIDDGVILGLVARMRGAGLHAFVVPQAPDLPMANRREDILIVKP
jgi:2-polyprenyl-3-methyl-5-hydroxy-6-metoxy-1,4-benzoquinol methylase